MSDVVLGGVQSEDLHQLVIGQDTSNRLEDGFKCFAVGAPARGGQARSDSESRVREQNEGNGRCLCSTATATGTRER